MWHPQLQKDIREPARNRTHLTSCSSAASEGHSGSQSPAYQGRDINSQYPFLANKILSEGNDTFDPEKHETMQNATPHTESQELPLAPPRAGARKKWSYFGVCVDLRKTVKSARPSEHTQGSVHRTFFSCCSRGQVDGFHQ